LGVRNATPLLRMDGGINGARIHLPASRLGESGIDSIYSMVSRRNMGTGFPVLALQALPSLPLGTPFRLEFKGLLAYFPLDAETNLCYNSFHSEG